MGLAVETTEIDGLWVIEVGVRATDVEATMAQLRAAGHDIVAVRAPATQPGPVAAS